MSVPCASNVATFATTGMTIDEIVTMSVSQDGSSNWANLGAAPVPSQSMIIPMPTEGNEDAASITSYRSATYGVATEGSIIKAICS
jgi:hypothetical protein